MFKVGETVGVIRLHNAYDNYASQVLGFDYLERLEGRVVKTAKGRSRRTPAQFKIKKNMPTKEEYINLKSAKYTTTVESLIIDGYSEIESLAGEMREWYDNMPEGFQQGDNGSRVDEAANTLENLGQPDLAEIMAEIKTVYYPALDADSRSARASEAGDMLLSAASAIQEYVSENKPEDEEAKETESQIDWDDLESVAQQCEDDGNEVQGVEFPGMYG